MNALKACKIAYVKLHLGDDSISEREVCDVLMDAICNEVGDKAFRRFLNNNSKRIDMKQPLDWREPDQSFGER